MIAHRYFISSILVITTFFSANSSDHKSYVNELSPYIAAQEALSENLQMPEPDPDGRIQTLNKKGAISPQLDDISRAFVEMAATTGTHVLEIGAGYGTACIEALKKGAESYAVNDLDVRHLKILASRVNELNPEYLSRITLVPGAFPDEVQIPEQCYDAILIARVLHFLSPKQVKPALRAAFRFLKPGGEVYAVMLSPYVRGYMSFIPTFEERVLNKEPFPGYVENLLDISDQSLIPESALKNMDKEPFLFFDKRTAKSFFEEAGFEVIKSVEMPLAYPSKIWQLDGRENIGVIAIKR